TEAGEELLRVARSADEQFEDFAGRLRGRSAEVSGEVVVTSIPLAAPLVMPGLRVFRRDHPDVLVRYEASWRILALQYGEAHVAIRAGTRPSHPDNVVRRFGKLRSGVYAHRDYLDRHGWPEGDAEGHAFVSESTEGAVVERWRKRIAPGTSVGFASSDARINLLAVTAGMGLSFLPEAMATREPDLVEVHAPRREWDIALWLVTHVDLHWTAKVQAVSRALLPG
ncbi:MAG: LysR family transcriptional regulator, partial [Myxococcota bacterium]